MGWPVFSRAGSRSPGLVVRAEKWPRYMNEPQTGAELERIRRSVRRGCPFGADGWVEETAAPTRP